MMESGINRRDFVKLSLATLSGFGLSPLIKGCTQNRAIVGARKTGAKELESHPAIPTPAGQCYLGWHHDIGYRISRDSDYWLKEKSAPAEEQILSIYKNKIGALPAVHSIADDFLGSSYYPKSVLETAVKMGVYPMIRYVPRTDWKGISKGDYDHHLQRFSQEVKKAALPALFTPFPGAGHYAGNHPWKDWDPEYFIPAWDRMFNIFQQQGANTYFVWGLHLAGKSSGFRRKRKYFRVPPEQVNWVGISIWNQTGNRSEPFLTLLGDDYAEFTALYDTKPFAIWNWETATWVAIGGTDIPANGLRAPTRRSKRYPIANWLFSMIIFGAAAVWKINCLKKGTLKCFGKSVKKSILKPGARTHPKI